jgi:hypothetical protein
MKIASETILNDLLLIENNMVDVPEINLRNNLILIARDSIAVKYIYAM